MFVIKVRFMYFTDGIMWAEIPKQIRSISDTFWYKIITMVTVGYDNMHPRQRRGKGWAAILQSAGLLFCIVFQHPPCKEYVPSTGQNMSKKEITLRLSRGVDKLSYTNKD